MRRSNIFILALSLVAVFAWVRASHFEARSEFRQLFGQKIYFNATVVEDPEYKNNKTQLVLLPDGAKQKIIVWVFGKQFFEYGDKLFVQGKLTEPKASADFDYRDYLAAKNIYGQIFYPQIFVLGKSKPNQIIFYGLKFKHFLLAQILKSMPEDRAGLLIALISGNRNFMQPEDILDFNNTGIAHAIAVSGYKLTLVFISIEAVLSRIGKNKILVLCIIFALVYLIIADFAPAVWRAAIMSAIFILAKRIGRKYRIVPALFLTAAILLIFNPLIIKYDLGFILSFSGILGIILFNPIVNGFLDWLIFSKFPRFNKLAHKLNLKEAFASTLSAQIATAPVIAYFFHQFSLVGPFTNLIIIPLLGPSIIAGYFCAVPVLGKLAAVILYFPLKLMLFVAHFFSKFKYSYLEANISSKQLIAAYLIIAASYSGLYWILKRHQSFDKINK